MAYVRGVPRVRSLRQRALPAELYRGEVRENGKTVDCKEQPRGTDMFTYDTWRQKAAVLMYPSFNVLRSFVMHTLGTIRKYR